ncbi:MAG TPA: RHS repeat-associated core domain-containing protein, partial [Nannocystaceae bacterium]|nr:RHS repeat-associated core domain-containing protein [Nannocystaceae bacterium]
ESRALVDGQGELAVTSREFDMTTGNQTAEKQPNGYDDPSAAWVTMTYDATQTFTVATTNELGHVVEHHFDAATGVELETRGPNEQSCAGCQAPVKEGTYRTIDGFGRTLTEHVFVDDAQLGYRDETVARFTWLDLPAPRTRVIEERIITSANEPWTRNETERDGLGRVVVERGYEGGAVRTVARSYFDDAGRMVRARLPRPDGASSVDVVDWHYAYDALGRLVAAREPTRSGCVGPLVLAGAPTWCGKRWTHDGLTTMVEDVTGTAGGQVARTRSTHDVMGRLVEVEEALASGDWAETSYEHDGHGRVLFSQNADKVITEYAYDLLGRRTDVLRNGKHWRFGYDGNGNLTSVTSPVPAGADPSRYVTLLYYDALDRLEGQDIAPRELSVDELALFADSSVAREYDSGSNGIGRLALVEHDAGFVSYDYDARGLPIHEQHYFAYDGGAYQDKRDIDRTYHASGALDTVIAADSDDPHARARFAHHYDGRGLLRRIAWTTGEGEPERQHIVDRYASGLVERNTSVSLGGAATSEVVRSYADAGRASSMVVNADASGGGLRTFASETFAFDGAGDVTTLVTNLTADPDAPSSEEMTLAYDELHRLVSASGTMKYQGDFAYSPGGRIVAAHVDAGVDSVHRRDVEYVYGGDVNDPTADPDAPIALKRVDGPGDYMRIGYDEHGNALARELVDVGTYEHVCDGLDRQRIVRNPDGTADVYYYGADGMRTLVATEDRNGDVVSLEWSVGNAKIVYDQSGHAMREEAFADAEGTTIRVVDHATGEYLFHDARSHLIAAIDEDGSLRGGFRYGPYGEILEEIGSDPAAFEKRFNGKERDDTSALTYYGWRYWDEHTLTWTQADPKYRMSTDIAATEPRRASLYAFSQGNPVSRVDPDGLDDPPAPEPVPPPPEDHDAFKRWGVAYPGAYYKLQEIARRKHRADELTETAIEQAYLYTVVAGLLQGYEREQSVGIFHQARIRGMKKRGDYQLAVDRQVAARLHQDLARIRRDGKLMSYARTEILSGAIDVLRRGLYDDTWSPRDDGAGVIPLLDWDRQSNAEEILTPTLDAFFESVPRYSMGLAIERGFVNEVRPIADRPTPTALRIWVVVPDSELHGPQ